MKQRLSMNTTSPALRLVRMAALTVAGLCFSAQAQAPLDIRIALVIGNSAYARAPLANPSNDARDMGQALRGFGFTVVELRDASREQMSAAIASMRTSLKGMQGVGMLYYAGHGMQLDWHNYMIPVDAKLSKPSDVAGQTIDVMNVLDAFKDAGNRMNILVLDACRDNPFAGAGSVKGLAQVDAPPGTFLAYATAPGNVALDGDEASSNGLYTGFLLAELKKPAAGIEDIFKRVRLQVRLKSEGRQIPWESTSLEEDFYFTPAKLAGKKRDPLDDAAFARETALWNQGKSASTSAGLIAYLQAYPSGLFSEIAQAKLDRMQKPGVTPQFKVDDTLANDTTTERFKVGDSYVYRVIDSRDSGPIPQRLVVTGIHDDVVEVNGGKRRFDLQGNPQSIGEHVWHDAQFFPAQYQVGKKWTLRAQIETDRHDDSVALEARVSAREKVVVAAGTFDVYRVDIAGLSLQGRRYAWTYWMNPKHGMPIKSSMTVSNPKGRVGKSVQTELMSMRSG
jgi:uncharacterized caspase-like protein